MTLRTIVLAAAAFVVALVPVAGRAGAPPVIVAPGTIVTPGACSGPAETPVCLDVPAASPVFVTCAAKKGLDGMLIKASQVSAFRFVASGGTLSAAEVSVTPGDTQSATVRWTTPAAESATVTCYAVGGVDVSSPSTAMVLLVAPPPQPAVSALVAPPGAVLVGSVLPFTVTASDPQGGTLSYLWEATAGTFTGQGTPAATWIAPPQAGPVTLTLTVRSDQGGAPNVQILTIDVASGLPQGALPAAMRGPRRIAITPSGRLAVADIKGRLALLTRLGGDLAAPSPAQEVVAVAGATGAFYASTADGNILKIDETTGQVVTRYELGVARGPTGLAWDEAHQLLWMAHRDGGVVQAIRPDGTSVVSVSAAGAADLRGVYDVAVDASTGMVWVAQEGNVSGPLVHGFQVDGTFVRSIVPSGTVYRAGGLAAAGGKVYVSDALIGTVQVLAEDGTSLGKLGSFGEAPGQLRMPAGLAFLPNGDLVVANLDVGRLDRFGNGAALEGCAGDTDCDGLSDEAELAAGLDPANPADALADADHDGLSNQREVALGTNPFKADSDGDGYGDAEELASGFDPLDPNDHGATLVASAPAESGPGLVRVTGVAGGPGTCAVTWKQVGGPTVSLRGATTATPSFIARAAATYVLEGVTTCTSGATRVASAPARVSVAVTNAAPVADGGRVAVVERGDEVELSGAWSTDANGGRLALAWQQSAGPAARVEGARGTIEVRPLRAGYHAFTLTARDAAGAVGTAEVPVILVERATTVPTAMALSTVVTGQVGVPVQLEVISPEGKAFSWEQASGPKVEAFDARVAAPSFTPAMAGRYVFRATAWRGEVRSAPETVEVFVAEAGAALPVARAVAPAVAAVNAPVALDGAASTASAGGTLRHRWRQVTGPAAGLTDADRAGATVVAFAPGFYEFELTVTEGEAAGVPVRVAFDALLGHRALPVAAVSAPGTAVAGDLVTLDGSGSTSARGFTWTQVAGPWVALGKADRAVTTFVPPTAGQYVFELVVHDGSVRSRPKQVSVLVMAEEN